MSPPKNQLHGLYDAVALLDADGKTVLAGELWKDQPANALAYKASLSAYTSKYVDMPPPPPPISLPPTLSICRDYKAYQLVVKQQQQHLAIGAKASCVTGRKGSQLTFFNPFSSVWKTAIAAKNTVDDFNFKGVGSIMGGIIVMQRGSGGVEYIFTEKNFGQYASNEEIIAACTPAARQQQKGSKHRLKATVTASTQQ
ncbi:TPA: hypothetical protein ACH3X2_009417 [Trebouxia sp. C0005]